MPKAKRALSEEQRQALVERLAKARAAKAAKKAEETNKKGTPVLSDDMVREELERVAVSPREPAEVVETIQNSDENTDVILRRALEAIETLAKLQAAGINTQAAGAQINNGRVVGTVKKYSIDPSDYPSPVDRLKNEPRLAQFAFPINYDLVYDVTTTAYQNQDGINHIEPKFNLQLHRLERDPITGDATGRRVVLCRLIMHEDPQSALTVARENGVNVDEMDELAFLNEMRYIQMRDWLLESFFKPISVNRNEQTEEVINGQIVEVITMNDQDTSRIPFEKLTRFKF